MENISTREWRKYWEYNCNKNPRDLQQVWDTEHGSMLDGKRREIEDLWNIGNTLGKYWISWKRWDMEKRKKPGRMLARNTRIGRLPTRINIETFEKCRDTGNCACPAALTIPWISRERENIYFQNPVFWLIFRWISLERDGTFVVGLQIFQKPFRTSDFENWRTISPRRWNESIFKIRARENWKRRETKTRRLFQTKIIRDNKLSLLLNSHRGSKVNGLGCISCNK